MIYNDYLVADRQDMMFACLGELTYPINTATKKAGNPYYGMNGALNSRKNTSVSAVIYRSQLFPDISLVNPHAVIPINPKWLTGTTYSVNAAGLVVETNSG